ncbi:thiol reductant ABC exporter subunit CydD [Parenemella sanctibonifatiensis]|uniref:Thiol reductant ABC exporter subunit CydD n=1 Tax=Parenemella sanctibonifatiensis TaxID=2016505 RepID=A0A255EJT5_9ACTN|nr:thiol reductant ABC exporter subunit CydD [Parenemella sanctibonifatiensis]OYN91500.1 thiol reductant ABC exporter subunit CydD [Parenemella sanctibonifatiensis]
MAGPIDPRLLRRARATRQYLLGGAVVGCLTAALVVVQAWLLSGQMAAIFHGDLTGPFGGLAATVGLLVLVLLGRAVLAWANQWLAHRSAAAVKSQLRRDVAAARLRRPAYEPSTGAFITLLSQGLDALDDYFGKYLPQLMLAATVPLIVGVAILSQDLISAITIAITIPLIPAFMALVGYVTRDRMRKRWTIQTKLAHHFADLMAGLPTLQVFGRARAQLKGLERTEGRHRSETMGTLRIAFISSFVLELLATLSVALVAVGIGLRVVYGQVELAAALFILILAPEVYLPVRQVGAHYHDSAEGVAAAEEAFEVIEAAEAEPTGVRPAPDLRQHRIRFEAVSFTHPEAAKPSLVDFSAEIAPGEVVAIQGRSGGGKSTLLQLLIGHLRPSEGRILVGEEDLSEVEPSSWWRQLAWVGQEPGLLTGTVADSIAMGLAGLPSGSETAPSESALRQCLDTVGGQSIDLAKEVGDESTGLSAGERRRVALARALLRATLGRARLMILDEPTAGLDTSTEARVIEALREAGVGVLVVSHRPAVIAAADRVLTVGVTEEVA